MTLAEMQRFDKLRYMLIRNDAEEKEFQDMLERVIKGKDGLSEFPTEDTEIVKEEVANVLAMQVAANVAKFLLGLGEAVLVAFVPALFANVPEPMRSVLTKVTQAELEKLPKP